MTDETTQALLPVTRADRDAAADFMDECAPYLGDCGMKNSVQLALVQAFARHRLAHSRPSQADAGEGCFQTEVGRWMLECFGEEIAADRIERADRFIEEALELAQTIPGFTVDRARALVEYVFARPVGERGQEVGGVGVTLAALCNTYGLNIEQEWRRELARVWTKVEAIRAKQASKPTGSALPIASPPTSGEEMRLREALGDFGDDYMTSEQHHPGYVLIPSEQFERIRAAFTKGAE